MKAERIKELATLVLNYYTVGDAEAQFDKLSDDERQGVLEEITAQLGR